MAILVHAYGTTFAVPDEITKILVDAASEAAQKYYAVVPISFPPFEFTVKLSSTGDGGTFEITAKDGDQMIVGVHERI